MLYDVIIVGAGPAGATVARHTARQGLKTILLDKEHFPRYKPCAGGLTPAVKRLSNVDYDEAIERVAAGIIVYSATEQRYVFAPPRLRLELVSRERFDQCLVAAAIREGAEFVEGVTVRNVELADTWARIYAADGSSWRGRIIVGADGASSRVARLTGLAVPSNAVALEVELMPQREERLADVSSRIVVGFINGFRGYGWIFPKKTHLSVGVAAFFSKKDLHRLSKTLERFMSRFAFLKQAKIVRQQGWPLPIHRKEHAVNSKRVCLVGDAASLVDPFTGEGIYYAMLSGILAAEAINRDLSAYGFLTDAYTREVHYRIMQNLQSAVVLSDMFYLNPSAFLMLARFFSNKRLSAILEKQKDYQRMLKHVVPGLLPSLKFLGVGTNHVMDKRY